MGVAQPHKTDEQIQDDVTRELRADTRVATTVIGVSVRGGVVTLTGSSESWARRYAAQQAAHRVAGVLDVANDIQVRPPGSPGRTDTDIALAVRQALEWDARVPQELIASTVSEGHVRLDGAVDFWSQREDAEDAVRYLEGVQGVTNAITVANHFVSPADVRLAIAEALHRQSMREVRRIDLGIENGIVTLQGTVRSWAERRATVGAAGAVRGVRAVKDDLRIDPMS